MSAPGLGVHDRRTVPGDGIATRLAGGAGGVTCDGGTDTAAVGSPSTTVVPSCRMARTAWRYVRSFSTGRSVAEVAPGSVRMITANGASADGARSTSYTSGAVTGLPSVRRAGGRQE